MIATRNGVRISVAQIAQIEYTSEDPILWRRNRNQVMTVRADLQDGVKAPDATMALWGKLVSIRVGLPPGYRLEIGGAIEASSKVNASIYTLFLVMLLSMLSFLMIQLQSFCRQFLVMLTAPLGIIGALNAFGRPFGFAALLGLIALVGMIMGGLLVATLSDAAVSPRPLCPLVPPASGHGDVTHPEIRYQVTHALPQSWADFE